MAIGRTEDWDTARDSVMLRHRESVCDPIRVTHLGQRSIRPHSKAGHMTAIDQSRPRCKKPLRGGGRPHMSQSPNSALIDMPANPDELSRLAGCPSTNGVFDDAEALGRSGIGCGGGCFQAVAHRGLREVHLQREAACKSREPPGWEVPLPVGPAVRTLRLMKPVRQRRGRMPDLDAEASISEHDPLDGNAKSAPICRGNLDLCRNCDA